ncbi:MAG: hypothetical protein HDT00_02545 [Bacteroidales bacterium]|nr:hypothetical protein [Bacteroidales bacterium]
MKLKNIVFASVLVVLAAIGIQKQKEVKYYSNPTLANLSAVCDKEGSIDIEYDAGCIALYADGCCPGPFDWRPYELPYN